MTADQWFYHVAYQYRTATGTTYGDLTLTSPHRINSGDRFRNVREEIANERARDRVGELVITSVTLLAEPDEVTP